MNSFAVIFVSSLIIAVSDAASAGYGPPKPAKYGPPEAAPEPANYKFDYNVNDPNSGDMHSRKEERMGNVVKGTYSLLEADGTMREVEYTADENGFNAVVKKTGTPKASPQSSYGAPKSSYGAPNNIPGAPPAKDSYSIIPKTR